MTRGGRRLGGDALARRDGRRREFGDPLVGLIAQLQCVGIAVQRIHQAIVAFDAHVLGLADAEDGQEDGNRVAQPGGGQ